MVCFKGLFYYFLLVILIDGRKAALRKACDPLDELPCNDGFCIEKIQWCDSVVDCKDKSDESYCSGRVPCLADIHFQCKNGKCVPDFAVCDDFDDCHDFSDEENCNGTRIGSSYIGPLADFENFIGDQPVRKDASEVAVAKAVEYLLSKRESDDGWGTFTPRAVIALSFAGKGSAVAEKDLQLMKKQLNIRLLLDLMKSKDVSLSTLALYINALYATCEDPSSFQGMNLVARLRSETDKAVKLNTSIPLAFLTLCLSNETKYPDNIQLANMYNTKKFMQTGSRSLILMAMACIAHKDSTGIFVHFMNDFFANESANVQAADIYSQILYMQASIAVRQPLPINELLRKQLPDGSFGDLLATYYAIPVLLGSSLLDTPCSSKSKVTSESSFARDKGEKEVIISLWLNSGNDVTSHTMTVRFDGLKTLFDVMMEAAFRDPMYRFLYDETDNGKIVYSLASIPNDIEGEKSWVLYSGNVADVRVNDIHSLQPILLGVDKIYPDGKDHYVFWLKRNPATV